MQRLIALVLVLCLLLTGCSSSPPADADMISGVGQLQFSAESSEYEHTEEFPPSYTEISRPEESSSAVPESSSSQPEASSSSSQPPVQQSSSSQSQSEQQDSSSSSQQEPEEEQEPEEQPSEAPSVKDEISAVWVSYLDLGPMLTGKTKAQFTANIGKAFDKIADTGFNTVIVQVRPFADALYQSDYFPWSYLCTGTEGEDPGYDPLAIMVRAAHDRNLEIEAWLNPYRVRAANYTKKLCEDNPARLWLDEGSDAVVEYGGGIYYNPASEDARELILNGVEEIVENYNVDGIHMDDYFYPNPDKSFDADSYAEYNGDLSLGNWRRQNVNTLVRGIYATVKDADSSVRFGISPTGNNDNNYNQQYADVKKWSGSSGYVDYICPQIYWGYNHASMPYAQTVKDWDNLITHSSVKLIVGIGAYRLGEAGEWSGTTDILARMVKTARKADNYGGIAVYRYDSLYNSPVPNQAARECSSLSNVL